MGEVKIESVRPLFPMQEGILFHNLLNSEDNAYFEQLSFSVKGELNLSYLEQSFNELIKRYDVLRTVFIYEDLEKPLQVILKERKEKVQFEDISHLNNMEQDTYIKRYQERDREIGFDLQSDLLIRMTVLQTESQLFRVILSHHHILMDGWCFRVVLKELFEIYAQLKQGIPLKLSAVYSCNNYIEWLEKQDRKMANDYWKGYLSGFENCTSIPKQKKNDLRNFHVNEYFIIDETITGKLYKMASSYQVTLNHLFQAAWSVLLQNYNNTEDVVFGTVVSGRPSEVTGIEKMVGLFINTIPVRVTCQENMSFEQLLSSIKESALASTPYHNALLAEIQANSSQQQSVFDHILSFQNFSHSNEDEIVEFDNQHGLILSEFEAFEQTNYDFTLMVGVGKELNIKVIYDTGKYEKEFICKIGVHLRTIFEQIITDPEQLISNIKLVDEEEQQQILSGFNNTKTSYPQDCTLKELFEEQVQKHPDQVALVFGERNMTYRELDRKANGLAHHLQAKGVKADTLVGLLGEHSLETLVSMVAILKTGGAYLPIDPNYPLERKQYMMQDSGLDLVVATENYDWDETILGGEVIQLSSINELEGREDSPIVLSHPKDLAYVLYTSGSTGQPKGVMVEQRNVVRLIKNTNFTDLSQGRLLLTGAIVFDASTFEIWGALLNGLTLSLIEKDTLLNLFKLQKIIERQKITTMWLTAPLFNQISQQHLEVFENLTSLIVGGDVLSPYHINAVRERYPNLKLINGYGPTENTTFSTTFLIEDTYEASIPIGRPIANSTAYVLNPYQQLCPVGIPGELYVGGAGVARGYLNKPELTTEKFIDNPFVPGERLYRTGDMVRWLADGNIEYIGRIDKQIKIRGHRIEPGEIVSHFLNHEAIQEAAVVPLQDSQGDAYLCAYYVPVEGIEEEEYTESSLRAYLSTRLPDYMMPSAFCQLGKLPLTVNGKLDTAALPEPDRNMYITKEYVPPQNETERKLSVIWQEVLGIEEVGRFDHFFESGGHSLKAMLLVSRIVREFEVTFQVKDVFHSPVLYQMAETIEQMNPEVYLRIEPVESRDFYPVSSAQQRIHVASQLATESVHYNVPLVFEIEGDLQKERLVEAFEVLIERHEALRTSFHLKEETLVQCIHKQVDFSLEEIEGTEESISKLLQQFVRPFDLTKPLLMRAGLLEVDTKKRLLLVDLHHIITDGMSTNILLQELVQLYQKPTDLEPLCIQYKDYAVWQQEFLQTEGMKRQEAFWLEKLEGELPILELPIDFPRPSVQQFEGAYVDVRVNRETTEKLQALTKEENGTLYMTLLAAYNVLLARYTGQEDFIVGTPIAGRPHADLEPIVGMFVNTLAIRNKLVNDKPFRQFLQEVRENVLKSYEHQMYPLEDLIEKLKVQRDMSRNPLFDTIFTLQNVDLTVPQGEGFMLCPYPFDYQMSKVDVTVGAVEEEGELHLRFEYSTALFTRETIEQMSTHFCTILQKIANHPDVVIANIDVTTEEEKERLIVQYNKTETAYPKNKSLAELFEEQVQKYPDQVALVYGEQSMTYRELDRKANGLAHRLQAKGVKADTLVGLLGEHSLETLVSMVAILKAGGAYLPIDPNYPLERKQYMMQDSGLDLVVATENYDWDETILGGEVIQLSSINELEGREDSPIVLSHPKDLAYVLYTSGSTGQPKGVMVEQRNVVRLIKNTNFTDLSQGRLLLTGAIVFDASTFEIWGALLNGLTLSLIEKDTLLNPFKLQKIIERQKITTMWLTAPLFNQISQQHLEVFENLTSLIVGGDVLSPYHINAVRERYPNLKLINGYGPTENTTFSTTFLIEDTYEASIPIGRPIANSTAYVLNPYQQLCPVGIPGELYVGGAGVARGYLNKPELTTEKFIDNPFVPGERLYRTGDMVRWLVDGNIEYIGRIDKQIKIRGHRIEPGEIVSHLLNHEAIQEAAVVPLQDSQGDAYLFAYYVPVEGVEEEEYTESSLRAYLSTRLPDYMMPSAFCQLEKLPLTVNGKLNAGALPELDRNMYAAKEYVPPQNETERKLSVIWQEVLGIEGVGRLDHFFECGGHSLKAMQLISLIHQKFQVNILLREIFKNPILCDMSKVIQSKDESLYNAIEIVNKKEFYPASSAQIRMYVTQQLDRESVAYNMPIAFRFTGILNIKNIEQAFRTLMHRHESLRTSVKLVEGQVVQQVQEELKWSLEVKNIKENSINDYIEKFVRPFDLACAPLIRVNLLKLSETEHILLLDTHHIISDGASLTILLREFIELYEGGNIKPLRIQYKDYAVWQRKLLQSENLKQQEKYWLSTMSGELPVLELPTDFLRPSAQSFTGDKVKVSLSEKWMNQLSLLNHKQGSTLFMTLCACYNILLSKYSGQEDIIIGTINNGRKHGDLEDIVGMFVNMLALRNYPKPNMSFYDFLESVKENVLFAFENQDYPFEDMVEKLAVHHSQSQSGNPLFNTMFSLQNLDTQHISTKKIEITSYNYDHRISKFDLTLEAFEYKGELFLEFEYATHLFERSTIERMAGHFIQILKQIVTKPDIKLSNIQMLGQEEKQLILGFNDKVSDYQKKTINEVFEEQVQKTPNAKAVVYEGESLTYEQLNKNSNQLAHILREKGVQAQQVVGLLATRSSEMLIGQMAILKAGGVYLPIDPSFPENRIEYMLQDSGVNILLTNVSVSGSWGSEREIIFINNDILYQGFGENLVNLSKPNDLAYIIYTSGSTGEPKGVMIEHHSVLNLSNWFCQKYDLITNCNVLQMTNISFDVSIEETLVTLLNGATIYIPKKEVIFSSNHFVRYLKENHINIAQFVPITLQELLVRHERLEDLHVVICGGEKLEKSLAKQILDKGYQLFNHYGPTEATVDTLVYDCQIDARKVPLGKPINNTRVYILDKVGFQLQPIGVPGELCIAGAGVARGYLGKSDMNAIKFVNDPFVPEEKMYRTGDWVRWLPDGNVEYLGRIDDQVKIRGHRIELGEIEENLLSHPFVSEAVVIARKDEDKQSYLCAYLVMRKEYRASQLREDLTEKLPNYMIPAHFVFLEKLPQLENGKINRKALPLPEYDLKNEEEYEAPSTPLELILSALWGEILNVQNPGVNANFFEIGGHSLKATFLASRIYKEIGIEVPIRVLFSRPTIKELAAYIVENKQKSYIAIQPVEERAYYPASSAQKRLYIMNQLEKMSTNYNMSLFMRINGKLNISQFCDAVDSLVQRHEILRTTFELIDEELVQRINENIKVDVSIQDANEQELSELTLGFIQPFDLQEGPLIRVALIKMNDEQYVLMLDMHHIVSDGTSINILLNELFKLYKGEPLELLELQYKDFASWEQEWKNSDNFQQQEQYWIEMFANDVPVMNMPTDYPRPPARKFEGSQVSFEINEELTQKLYALSAKYGTTLYINLLAMYNILLSKYTGQEDIVIGSPIAGRVHTEFESIVGMFVNTLALRNYPEPKIQFNVFLLQVKEVVLKSIENQSYPFEGLVEKVDMERDLSRNPLFDTMFVMQNTDDKTPEIDMQDIALSSYAYENKTARFDLTLSVTEFEGKIIGSMEYSTNLFRESTITRMAQNFIRIIEQLVHQTDTTIADLEVVTESEKKLLVNEFNDSEVLFQNDVTLHGLFEQQVKCSPEQVALIFGNDEITYEQLNTKANGLARTLRKKGIKPETMVGIMMESSIEMGIGLLAILKAGGAYVPIDPHYPEERIQHIIQDSQVNIIITQTHIKNCVEFTGEWLDVLDEKNYDIHSENLIFEQETDSLAYVIYTSGTTGNPKGTLIEHKSIVNMLQWRCLEYKFSTEHRILQLLSYAFDAFVANFFTPLLCGATVVLLKENEMKDLIAIKETIVSKKIAHFACVPSLYGALLEIFDLEDVRSLQSITLGGDKLSKKIRSLSYEKAPHIEIVNEYGPTENSVTTTISRNVQLADHIRIGRPISNVHTYVLNPQQHLQPIGVPGELYIGGAGLVRGYLNQPDLTTEYFLSIPSLPDHRLYRTGDIVRLHEDGQIEFLGRVDNQIKVRGYRIETDEIESALLQLEKIQEVVVIPIENHSDEKALCAYFVSKEELVESELRDILSKVLPFYMIPSYFMQIEKVPLTLNNKVDKKALPKPRNNDVDEKVLIEPVNRIEKILVTIWSEVLHIDKISTNESFFELGGDSIKAIKIVARLNNYNLNLEMKDVFQHPTIQQLSPYVQQQKIEINQDIVIGEVELTPVQHWFFEQKFTGQHHWNQSMLLHHIEGFKAPLVEKVFSKIVEHHDALRIIFKVEDREIFQVHRGLEETVFEMEEYDLIDKFDAASYIQKFSDRIQGSLNIYHGPLIKLGLYKTRDGDHLLIAIHHLIVDAVSWRILIEDFIKGYQQAEEQKRIVLQPKTHSFQEWSNELVRYRKNKVDEYETYWRSIDSNDVKSLPKDYATLHNFFKDTYTITESLSKEWTDNLLKRTNHAYSTEIDDVLLTALGLTVQEWTGEHKVALHMEGHGRESIREGINLSRTVGWFTSIYPVVLEINPAEDISYQIRSVKENLRCIPNKGIDYGILKYIGNSKVDERKLKLKPEISYNYLGQLETQETESTIRASSFSMGETMSPRTERLYTLEVSAVIVQGQFTFNFSYNKYQYDEKTIMKLVQLFKQNLFTLIEHCMSKKETVLTPSDVGDKDLSLDELEDIMNLIDSL